MDLALQGAGQLAVSGQTRTLRATLAGVATSSPERSREAAERLGAEEAYATSLSLAGVEP